MLPFLCPSRCPTLPPSREVARLLQRKCPTSLQNLGNYSREVSEPDEWQVFAPAVHLPKWTRPSGQEDAWCSIGGSLLMPANICKTKKVRHLIGSLTFLYYILCLLRIFRRRNRFRREDCHLLCPCSYLCRRPCLCHRSDRNANKRKAGRNCAPFRSVCRYGSLH